MKIRTLIHRLRRLHERGFKDVAVAGDRWWDVAGLVKGVNRFKLSKKSHPSPVILKTVFLRLGHHKRSDLFHAYDEFCGECGTAAPVCNCPPKTR